MQKIFKHSICWRYSNGSPLAVRKDIWNHHDACAESATKFSQPHPYNPNRPSVVWSVACDRCDRGLCPAIVEEIFFYIKLAPLVHKIPTIFKISLATSKQVERILLRKWSKLRCMISSVQGSSKKSTKLVISRRYQRECKSFSKDSWWPTKYCRWSKLRF